MSALGAKCQTAEVYSLKIIPGFPRNPIITGKSDQLFDMGVRVVPLLNHVRQIKSVVLILTAVARLFLADSDSRADFNCFESYGGER
jgi:hypothetical protein